MTKDNREKVNYNPPVPDIVRNYDNAVEYGRVGQKRYAGVFWEEFVPDLRGTHGVRVYQEMADNDDVIGAILFAIENLMRQVTFSVQPAGETDADKRAAEFIEECMYDMEDTWADTLSEILSFLTYGWGIHEIVYKRRMGLNKNNRASSSKYSDGLIGWRRLPIRSQDTLYRWEYNEYDELVGMTQIAPPDYQMRTIPIDKCLHFRTRSRKNNPEGRSILRNCYRSWYFKKRLQEIEGIGIERDLAGLPMITPPEGYDIWDRDDPEMVETLAYAETLVKSIRRDEREGIVLPYGWDFRLLNGGSRRQFEVGSTIERYDRRMTQTVLADFIMLGNQGVGSYALSSDKTKIFAVAIGSYLDAICEAFNNQAIPKLVELNTAALGKLTDYPEMIHSDIEKPDIDKAIAFIEKMVGIGLIVPDEQLEDYARELGGLPERQQGDVTPNEYQQRIQQAKNKANEGEESQAEEMVGRSLKIAQNGKISLTGGKEKQ